MDATLGHDWLVTSTHPLRLKESISHGRVHTKIGCSCMTFLLAYRLWLGMGGRICHVDVLGGCSRQCERRPRKPLVDAEPTVAPRICRGHTISDEAKPSGQTIAISIGPWFDGCRLTRQRHVERVGPRVPIRQSNPCLLLVAPMLDYRVLDMCCNAVSIVPRRWRATRIQSQYLLRVLLK